MKEPLTAVFEKSPYGYIGYVEELPGANTQGETLEETKANLIEAVQLVLQANRELAEEEIKADKREIVSARSSENLWNEIDGNLAKRIFKDLGLPRP